MATNGGSQDVTHLFRPKMPVLRHGSRLFLLQQPPHGGRARENAKHGHRRHPHVDEARREIISKRAHRAPSFLVAAERLPVDAFGAQITAADPGFDAMVAGEGARLEDHLLSLCGPQAVAELGRPHWQRYYGIETASRDVIAETARGNGFFVVVLDRIEASRTAGPAGLLRGGSESDGYRGCGRD